MPSTATWKSLSPGVKWKILRAMDIQYTQGNKPTYTLNQPMSVKAQYRNRKTGTDWLSLAMAGSETFSPTGINANISAVDKAELILTPLGMEALKKGISAIRLSIPDAIAAMTGFSKHMDEIILRIDDELLEETRIKTEERERLAAEEERRRIEFTNSGAWGEF